MRLARGGQRPVDCRVGLSCANHLAPLTNCKPALLRDKALLHAATAQRDPPIPAPAVKKTSRGTPFQTPHFRISHR